MIKKTNFIWILFYIIPLFSQVMINEYSASNLTIYTDNYNLEEDWIELYNSGPNDIDLNGYFLSDNPNNPQKWVIPSATIIQAEGYLIFWCSGRDEVSNGHFHTNFKLKQTTEDQEFVIFSAPNGDLINEIELTKTQLDHSFGRSPSGYENWGVFDDPTLGSENDSFCFLRYAASAIMSLDAGFYNGTQELILSSEESDADIFYTTNGNLPIPLSNLYSNPITINETQIIKAIVISNNPNILPSFITFNTYFIDEDHTLPVISSAANQLTVMLNGNQTLRPHGSIEYFDSDGGRRDFGYGEYNKHGQDSWAFPQRSFDYIARDEMGYHDAVHEKLLSLSDRDAFQRLIMRASGDDNYPGIDSSAHMRDIFIQKMANKNNLNVDMRRGERCVVYANGQYWGVYSIREKVSDSDYTNYYYGQDKYNIQYVMNWGNTWAQYGGEDAISAWNSIKNYVLTNDLSIQNNYDYVSNQIDITSLVDYVLINSLVVCTDWINWNTSVWRGLDPNGSHQKWGFVLWDEDATFNHYINYTGVPNEQPDAEPCYPEGIIPDPLGVIDILNKLRDNEEFSQYYITRYMDLLNTAFNEDNMIEILEGIENSIAPEMPQHIERWGGNFNQWSENVQKIKNFIRDRIEYFPQGLNECYNLTGPFDVTLEVQPQNAGEIRFNSLTIDPSLYPWTGQYHGRIDMIVEANSTNLFSHWELNNHDIPNPTLNNFRIDLESDESITAYYSNNNTPNILINEINYNSPENFESGDWVELINPTSNNVDISGWILKDDNDEHLYPIPENTIIEAAGFIIICNDISAFIEAYPNVEEHIGEFNFGFSGSGDILRLFNPNNILIDFVEYEDSTPWPAEADGEGSTLELIDIYSDNSLPENWAASINNGTPGAVNSVSIIGDVNSDGLVNVSDVIIAVNIVLDNDYSGSADINNDNIVDILDVIQLVNIILGPINGVDATTAFIYTENNAIKISANGYIGAVQFSIVHDHNFELNLTENALVAQKKVFNNRTEVIIVSPSTELLLTASSSFKINEIIVANSKNIINLIQPNSFSLNGIFPNPFNTSTQIEFSIPYESHVNIKVFNILGENISTIVNANFNSGIHSIVWNAEKLASGIYFVQFSANKFSKTQKVILLK